MPRRRKPMRVRAEFSLGRSLNTNTAPRCTGGALGHNTASETDLRLEAFRGGRSSEGHSDVELGCGQNNESPLSRVAPHELAYRTRSSCQLLIESLDFCCMPSQLGRRRAPSSLGNLEHSECKSVPVDRPSMNVHGPFELLRQL